MYKCRSILNNRLKIKMRHVSTCDKFEYINWHGRNESQEVTVKTREPHT